MSATQSIVSDRVSVAMQDLGSKHFGRFYFTDEQLARMAPEEREKAKQLEALTKLLSDWGKRRREQNQVADR